MGLSTFICRDDVERAWQLDLHRRLDPVMRASCGVVGIAFLAASPWLAPWSAIPAVLAAVLFAVASALVTRFERLDPLVYAWFVVQALIVTVAIVDGDRHEGAVGVGLTIMLWPLAGAAGGFPTRLVAVCVGYTCALYSGAVLVIQPDFVLQDPPRLIWPLSMFVALTVISTAVRQASMEHRAAAVFDSLTGLLNRGALNARVVELEVQAQVASLGVAVIVLDIDRFKRINDEHGHEMGDAVLREAAYRWRKALGPFEPIYRFGGEEFVAIVPGVDAIAARSRAEQLCEVIRATPIAGIAVTVSAGIATSRPPNLFSFKEQFSRADAALYTAKQQGRDRLCDADDLAVTVDRDNRGAVDAATPAKVHEPSDARLRLT